ncbi:response regulator [Ectothiorhodospiraceae bacterium WFHF3C12]|nr:response regulator [Ectothiorhodospiraceae bacterium WFHF3C12]
MANQGADAARVLLIDDSKLIRFSAQKILGSDFEVVLAEDGEDGWANIESDPGIGVVFTDLSMPNLDGFGLLERVRGSADSRIRDLPVIVVTSGEEVQTRQKAFDLGATDFITKPFDSVNLLARARAHASRRAGADAGGEDGATDPVTTLRSKPFFLEQIHRDRALAARHGHEWAVLFVELAQFREFFLKHGKDRAYEVLGDMGRIVRRQVREEDTAARVGLSQIALSVPMTGESGIGVLAQRLHRALARAQLGGGNGLPVALAAMVPDPADKAVERHLQRLGRATANVIGEHGGGMVRLRPRPAAQSGQGVAAQR